MIAAKNVMDLESTCTKRRSESMLSRVASAAVVLIFFLTQPIASQADDGGISFGGSPRLLKSHKSVSMQSEVVNIDVHDKLIYVDCLFVFHNQGPACTVRMGFPDHGQGAEEPYQGDPVPTGPNLHATFKTYTSYVDGKKVPTEIVPTADRSLYWHAKTVKFKAHSDCIIRDIYTLPPGKQVTDENGMYTQTYYVLQTGSSWHGPIKRAEVIVRFEPDSLLAPIHLKALSTLPEHDITRVKWSQLPAGTLLYEGPCRPVVKEETLKFFRTNFEPGSRDDIHLYYAYRKLNNLN
jgi:hypothetical protein